MLQAAFYRSKHADKTHYVGTHPEQKRSEQDKIILYQHWQEAILPRPKGPVYSLIYINMSQDIARTHATRLPPSGSMFAVLS
jgi:hypothetical protein